MKFKEFGEIVEETKPSFQEFGEIIDENTPPQQKFSKADRYLAQAAKGALNLIPGVAGYNLLTTGVREGAYKSRERVSEQARKDLEAINSKIENGEKLTRQERFLYDRTKALAERKNEKALGIDTESLINRGVEAATGENLEPEDLGEEIVNIGAGIANPRSIFKMGKLATKAGRASLQAEKAASGYKSLENFVKGKAAQEQLLDLAKKNQLTPREATLLVQSEGKLDKLLKISRKTKAFKKDIEGIGKKLGNQYEELKAIGAQKGRVGSDVTLPLMRDFEDLIGDLDKTLFQGPETVGARKALNKTLRKLESEGTTIEELINTRQNLGQQINWGKVDTKGILLKRGREFLAKAVERADPYVGKQLRLTDKGWERFEKLRPILEKKPSFLIKTKWGEIPLEYLAFGAAYFSPTALKGLTAKEGIQRFSTALLTNPKLQGVSKNILKAATTVNPDQKRKLMIAAERLLRREDPELYEEMGFEDLTD